MTDNIMKRIKFIEKRKTDAGRIERQKSKIEFGIYSLKNQENCENF